MPNFPELMCEICGVMHAIIKVRGPNTTQAPIRLCSDCNKEAEALTRKFRQKDNQKSKKKKGKA